MRLIFVNRFFYPDQSATSLMLGDLVFALDGTARERHVITSRSHYLGSAEALRSTEVVRGVTVHRVTSLRIGNQSLFGRVLNFLNFYLFGFFAAVRVTRPGDVIVCLTDPPLASVVIRLAARLKRARLVNWLQDIYPETANRLGYGAEQAPLSRLLGHLRDANWRNAETNVVIGRRMENYVASLGVDPRRVRLIPNWADELELTPLAPENNALRIAWAFAPTDCIVGYSGNLGRAHDIETMLGAIELCASRRDSELRFLFIGGGAKLNEVRRLTQQTSALKTSFRSYQPRTRLRESLSVPDIHWMSLDPALEGLIVPSKFYGAAAVGRPILFIGDPDGEIAQLIAEGECGRTFAPGQSEELAAYLRRLERDPELRRALGNKARLFSEHALNRADRLAEWQELLAELGSD